MSSHIISIQSAVGTLRAARRSSRVTQAELGRRLGLPQAHVSAMEAGKIDVRASTLVDWSRALGLELVVVHRSLVPVIRNLERESIPRVGNAPPSRGLYETSELDEDDPDNTSPTP